MRSSDGTLLGRDRCVEWLLECRTEPVERIVDELLAATRTFVDGAELHDDLTMVVVKTK